MNLLSISTITTNKAICITTEKRTPNKYCQYQNIMPKSVAVFYLQWSGDSILITLMAIFYLSLTQDWDENAVRGTAADAFVKQHTDSLIFTCATNNPWNTRAVRVMILIFVIPKVYLSCCSCTEHWDYCWRRDTHSPDYLHYCSAHSDSSLLGMCRNASGKPELPLKEL